MDGLIEILMDYDFNNIIRVNNDHSRSNDLIYLIDDNYVLKISNDIKNLRYEYDVCKKLSLYINVGKALEFRIINNKAYFLRTMLNGLDLACDEYLNRPFLLIDILADAINKLHSIDINNLVNIHDYKNGNVLVHGDFCLPNVIVNDDKFYGLIDLSNVGIGDPWYDYAWAIWSLEYNLKTDKYTKYLLDKLNIIFDKEKYDFYINN